jgi:hypothetical protein
MPLYAQHGARACARVPPRRIGSCRRLDARRGAARLLVMSDAHLHLEPVSGEPTMRPVECRRRGLVCDLVVALVVLVVVCTVGRRKPHAVDVDDLV